MCRTEPKCVTTQNTQRQGVIWGYPQITPRLNVSQCLKQAIPGRMVRDGTDALPRYTLCQVKESNMFNFKMFDSEHRAWLSEWEGGVARARAW